MTDEAASSAQAQAAFGAPASPGRPPSRLGYAVGALLMALAVAGAILWVVLGFLRFGDAVDDLQRVRLATEGGVVRLSEGSKSIYYEADDAQERIPDLEIAIVPVDGGAPLDIGSHSGTVSYSIGGHTGESVASVRIPRDGRYRVTASASVAPDDAGLAIGDGIGSRIVGILVGGFAIFIGGGLLGAVALIITSTRRRRARAPG